MRLTLVISQLTPGGAERVMSTLASYWADRGLEVTLITLWAASSDFYRVTPRVRRVALGLSHPSRTLRQSLFMTWRRLQALRSHIRSSRPDVVVSFMDTTNMLTLLATKNLGVPVVVSERIHPAFHDIGRLRTWVRRRLYPAADALVLPSEGIRGWAEAIVSPHAVRVIPNPVRSIERVAGTRSRNSSGEHRVVVGMGRLEPQKQFDHLLRAFAQCSARHPKWMLAIIGDGAERGRLEELAMQLAIREKVRWLSQVMEPESVLRNADLFVLSSRYEGFPNALIEAMACGCAVISFDCSSGPSEIIRHGVDGILVPAQDLEALVVAMDRLMSDEHERKRLGARAVEVRDRFSMSRIAAMWDDLFRELGHDPGAPN
jgi:GalNAc-alpha-(1->4)-GalNAc-alpha-(1->3)-diNAcBac-PP-undecaprenol alpha-1,4-N-acetyl-D-galactosaminyltransferase